MQASFPTLLFLAALGSAAPSLASEPSTPMDCSDLALPAGQTCTEVASAGRLFTSFTSTMTTDNEGRLLATPWGYSLGAVDLGPCGNTRTSRSALVTLVGSDGAHTPLVTADFRCVDPATTSLDLVSAFALHFDPAHGSLYVQLLSTCFRAGQAGCPYAREWVARIDGFTSLGDVLPPPAPQCSNGIDDDGDGAIDTEDCSCKSAVDNDESPAWGAFQRRWFCRPPR